MPLEAHYIEEAEVPEAELIPQPHGGALRRGNPRHGFATFRNEVTPAIREKADEIREQLAVEFPGIEQLSLPTIELMCQAFARALLYNDVVMSYATGARSRKLPKGQVATGLEACPAHIVQAADRAAEVAAKMAESLGLDLTGRVKALKDDAIKASLNGTGTLNSFASQGRKLRQLRGRGA